MPSQVHTYMPVAMTGQTWAPHNSRMQRPVQPVQPVQSAQDMAHHYHRHHHSIDTLPPIDFQQPTPSPPDIIPPGQSGPWAPEEDEVLLHARASGIGWDRVKAEYFPNKTSNACRKRYERLIAKRKANDWDDQRIQRLALAYRDNRQALWRPLADQLGEKWEHVEKACMERGLKTLQNLASNHTRVQAHARRISAGSGNGTGAVGGGSSDPYAYDDPLGNDDSGIGMGIDGGSGGAGSRRSSGSGNGNAMLGWNQILQ